MSPAGQDGVGVVLSSAHEPIVLLVDPTVTYLRALVRSNHLAAAARSFCILMNILQ